MGKKKSKKSKQDARGYSTVSVQRAPPPPVPIATATATAAAAAVTAAEQEETTTANSRESSVPPNGSGHHSSASASASASASTASSKRFTKKIETLYDQLSIHFSDDQINVVIQALANSNNNKNSKTDLWTLETALDWFCLNLPTEELPALFTEQTEREAAVVQTGTEVQVMKLEKTANNGAIQYDKSVDQHLITVPAAAAGQSHDDQETMDEKEEAQKAWILNQYQFEPAEEAETAHGDDATNIESDKDGTTVDSPLVEKEAVQEAQALVPTVASPHEIQLVNLEQKVEEMRRSVNDDASNYMLSKHEIRDMKKELSKLQGQAKKLRGKVAKIKAAAAATVNKDDNDDSSIKEQEKKEIEVAAVKEDDDVAGGFGMFDEVEDDEDVSTTKPAPVHEEESAAEEEETNDPFRLRSTEPSIPNDWTGTTPKKQLEEWCKKQKIARPAFTKLPNHGCRVKVKSRPVELTLEQEGPFFDFNDAQQHVATQALYSLMPDLPMYRMFPPTFRDIWKGWISRLDDAKSRQKQDDRDAKEDRICQLLELIPKRLQLGDMIEEHGMEDSNDETMEEDAICSLQVVPNWDDARNNVKTKSAGVETQSKTGRDLKAEFARRRKTPDYQAMEEIRRGLPMHNYRSELLNCVNTHAVTVLCAETGAGKTTQGPQFMLEEALSAGVADTASIICTQPRRISAMSVAERVADEMCVRLGDLVGYQIRGEVKKSPRTKLLFCTTGVVLRKLQEDPLLSGVTTVVVDEVHERSWQIDFLLIALRRLLQTTRPNLKVVLMSATLDSELFCSFFGGAPLVNVPGRTYPVANYFLEDLYDATNHTIEEDSMYTQRDFRKRASTDSVWVTKQGGEKQREVVDLDSQTDVSEVSGFYPGYQMTTQRSMDRVDEKVLNYDLIEDVLALLTGNENDTIVNPSGINPSDGAFLVFLPGMAEIRSLTNRLTGSRKFGNKQNFEVIPLHSSLSPQEQKRAFATPRAKCRKIILATNIAETSVTIPDVVCVIDAGLVREVRQDKRYATSKLVLDWCSKASIKQRAGRAGRVKEGICCRLFSSRTAKLFMKDQTTPELQRVPLEEVCLSILAGNLSDSCTDFLMQAPQPPPLDSVSLALRLLTEVGAVKIMDDNREKLTALGLHVAKIPVHVRLAKMLIFGAVFKCLDPILTIVASLSGKSPFATVMNDATRAAAAHKKFRHFSSDFLGFVELWDVFTKEVDNSRDQGRGFCRRNFINWTVMMEIRDLRRQNLELLCQIGFVRGKLRENDLLKHPVYNQNGANDTIVHAVVCAGLYPNIARAVKEHVDDPPVLWHQKERLFFHSSSVNHGKKKLLSDWIVFHEKFSTGRTTVSATSPIHPLTLILFGGDVVVKHLERKVRVDDWIELDVAAQNGVMFRELRRKLDVLLSSVIENADAASGDEMVDDIVELLIST